MKRRLAVATAGVLAGLMALGTANALVLDTTPGSESTASDRAIPGVETTYEVGDAGTVTLTNDGSRLDVVSVQQAEGWIIEIEVATGREVEVDFRKDTRRIQFNAELEDGEIRIRARERVVTVETRSNTSTTQAAVESTVVVSTQVGTVTYEAGAAGSVTISNDGSRLTVTDVNAADGWNHEIEIQVGREVEIDFRRGEDRVQFNAELEEGDVRVRVRTRLADGTRTEITNGADTTDDDDDNDNDNDNDDDSSDDESEDNSGRGNAGDRDDDLEDDSDDDDESDDYDSDDDDDRDDDDDDDDSDDD